MEAVGAQLDRAKESYNKAIGQLHSGKGNLISQASDFESLGVAVQARLPEHLVKAASLELEHVPGALLVNGSRSKDAEIAAEID